MADQCVHAQHGGCPQGILTVTVLRAINVVGWEGEPDTYVKLVLFDKVQRKQDKQRSSTVYNEPHPRWVHVSCLMPADAMMLAMSANASKADCQLYLPAGAS